MVLVPSQKLPSFLCTCCPIVLLHLINFTVTPGIEPATSVILRHLKPMKCRLYKKLNYPAHELVFIPRFAYQAAPSDDCRRPQALLVLHLCDYDCHLSRLQSATEATLLLKLVLLPD